MKRFGGNGALNEYDAFAAVPSPPCPPTLAKVTSPMLSSSPPTTAKENTLHAIQQPLPIQQMCTPLTVQQPIPPPVLVPLPSPPSPLTPATPPTLAPVTAPLLSSSSPDILQFQPSFLPLLQHFDPAAAADHAKLMVSSGPPTTTMVSAPRLSSSPDIQRGLAFASVHQSMQSMVSFPDPPYAAVGAPFSHLVMLLFLHIVGHLLWFNALATTQKYEFEPPPDEVLGFNLDLSLEGKAVLRVRQLIRIV